MGGRGYSSATARRSWQVKAMSGVKSYGIKLPGAAHGFTSKSFGSYMKNGPDKKIVEAQLKRDKKSEFGQMAQAMDKYMEGRNVSGVLYRGMSVDKKTLKALQNGKYPNRATLSSWSKDIRVAGEFATGTAYEHAFKGLKQDIPVMFEIRGGIKNAADMDKTVGVPRMYNRGSGVWVQASGYTEAEVTSASKNKFKIIDYDSDSYRKRGVHQFLVEQA